MQLGILTEGGLVLNAAPILLHDEKDGGGGGFLGILSKSNRNQKITALIELTKKLKKLDALKENKMILKTFPEKERIINGIIDILAEGDAQMAANGNQRMYKYSNELDMIRAQQAMIELGFHCLLFADNTRYEFKRDYYEMLSQIFLRDELKLTNVAVLPEFMEVRQSGDLSAAHMLKIDHSIDSRSVFTGKSIKFDDNTEKKLGQKRVLGKKEEEEDRTPPPVVSYDDENFSEIQFEYVKKEKVKIAQYYQKLLYQILDDCLVKFCRRDVEPYLKSYLEICISIAFFRVPRFQAIFLECVKA